MKSNPIRVDFATGNILISFKKILKFHKPYIYLIVHAQYDIDSHYRL